MGIFLHKVKVKWENEVTQKAQSLNEMREEGCKYKDINMYIIYTNLDDINTWQKMVISLHIS